MRLLADENFPRRTFERLQEMGHDILWIARKAPGSSDDEVLAMATDDKRILITFDKDFGRMVNYSGIPAPCGIILIRPNGTRPEGVTDFVVRTLNSEIDFIGNYTIVSKNGIKQKKLKGY